MLSRVQIASVAGLCALAALGGLVWGRASLPMTETDAINRMAARYIAQEGGEAEDCYAQPGPGEIWLTVYCDGAMGRFAYPLDRNGNIVPVAGGEI